MLHLLVQISKYFMIFLFLVYTFECFHVFRFKDDLEQQTRIYAIQKFAIFAIHLNAHIVLYATTTDKRYVGLYMVQLVFVIFVFVLYRKLFKNFSDLLLNNMCMLLMIGLIIISRISIDKAIRQFEFMVFGFIISIAIPFILKKKSRFRNYGYIYAGAGLFGLLIVAIMGAVSYGAKLSISIGGISIQVSEFAKILFVFFIAASLYKNKTIKQLAITSAIAAAYVLVLVFSRDLGSALLFSFTFLMMIYVVTEKWYVLVGGLGGVALAAFLGYKLFPHVQTRVIAWLDPLSDIDNKGYQICQSLFAIGTGGWFGLGLNQGMPNKIPVVSKDFIFAAISEEMGAIFALCLIMVCISCYLMIFNISMQLKDRFYKLVALGLGTTYALQIFLTIGGVTKFIPLTGVTLPFVSYGGSSLLATIILFGIIQSLYIMQAKDERGTLKNGR